ncbi:hypothetical protein ACQP2T_07280 [Nonomuraea sp. CA-143628]
MRTLEKLNPSGRLGTTDEVASIVTWLGSEAGAFYAVDGGFTAR